MTRPASLSEKTTSIVYDRRSSKQAMPELASPSTSDFGRSRVAGTAGQAGDLSGRVSIDEILLSRLQSKNEIRVKNLRYGDKDLHRELLPRHEGNSIRLVLQLQAEQSHLSKSSPAVTRSALGLTPCLYQVPMICW